MTALAQDSSSHPISPDLPPRGRLEFWASIIALFLAVFSYTNINRFPFIDPDEFDYITAARQMVEQGDWITPHFNGEARLVKPILFYWILGGAFKIFGIHIAVARLCSAAASMAAIIMIWLTARHLLGKRPALIAAVIAAGHLTVVQLSRAASVDTSLWAFTSLATYAFIRVAFPVEGDPPTPGWMGYLYFVATGLGVLTKGPVGLVWALVPMLWLIFRRDWTTLRRFPWLIGSIIVVVLIAPWAVVFVYRNAQQFHDTLLNPNSHESYAQFSGPIRSIPDALRIFQQLIPSVLPWIPLMVAAALAGRDGGFTARRPCAHFLIFWLAAILLILTLAHNKSVRYMLTPIAPTALLLAGWLDAAYDNPKIRRPLSAAALTCGITVTILIIPLLLFIFNSPHDDTRWLWAHVAVLLIASQYLLKNWRSPQTHRILPAIILALISVNVYLGDLSIPPIAGKTWASLAGNVTKSLAPDQPLVTASGLSPRNMVYLSRRNILEVRTFPQLLDKLPTIQACLVRQSDWDRVPPDLKAPFRIVETCEVWRHPSVFSLNLADNREPAILVARKLVAQTQPASNPSSPD
ncbi:MAG: glycosyltransferase family 39 protein [Tepidisphaeraceae bacterium]|jgi:4-amino-4-deoxy-L-arabinose transferase-like glycosyltransferase